MRAVATDVARTYGGLCVCELSTTVSWTDQDAVWGVDSRWANESRIRWGP